VRRAFFSAGILPAFSFSPRPLCVRHEGIGAEARGKLRHYVRKAAARLPHSKKEKAPTGIGARKTGRAVGLLHKKTFSVKPERNLLH
jgi:hypothetical protein